MPPGGAGAGMGPGDGPIRVLHVDDDPELLELASTLLLRERPDLSVTTATGAEEALDALDAHDFDCVVSDYEMPGTDGLELLEAVRGRSLDLPFVLFTGKGSEEIASEAISAGVTDYLQKHGGREQYAVLANRIENAAHRYRAERAVEATRRWHQRLVEESTDVILVLDPDGTVRYTSPSVEGVLGYQPAETTGGNAFEYVHPDDRERVSEGHAAIVAGDTTVPPVRFRCRHADGSGVTLESRSRNLLDDPVIEGIVVYVRDVSGQRVRERKLQRYASVVEASGDVVYALDPDGRFTFVNDAHEALTGFAEAEVLGEHISMVLDPADVERGAAVIRRLLRDDERSHDTYEFELQTKGGGRELVEAHVALLRDEDGEFVGSTGVLREVGDRRERERDLERYRWIVEAMGDGVYALDVDGRHLEFNEYVEELTGYDREELLGASPAELYDEADFARFETAIRELLSTGDPDAIRTVEATLHAADGEAIPVEVKLTLLPMDDGEFRGTVGAIRDVSDRREREHELEQYETIVETVPEGVFVLDEDVTILDGNRAAAAMFGYEYDELVGRSFQELIEAGVVEEEVVEKYTDAVRRLADPDADEDEVWFDYGVTVNGDQRIYETSVALRPPEESFSGTVGVIRDVTAQREREAALERYETVVEASGDGVYTLDPYGCYTFMNQANAEILGRDPTDLVGEHVSAVMDETEVSKAEALIMDLLESGRDHDTVELEVIDADGERVITETHIGLLPSEDGEFRGTVGFVRDISSRKEHERALERYETLVEASGDAMYALDAEGRYVFVNEALATLCGFDREALVGEHVSKVLDQEDVERGAALIRELLESGERRSGTFEMHVTTDAGERIPVENHVALLPTEDGEFRGTAGVLRDITERKAREETLEWYETIVEATGDQIYSLDPEGHFTYVNQALLAFWGYDEDEILGAHVSTFMDDDDVEAGEALIMELLQSDERRSGTYELMANTWDGDRIPVENHIAILEDEEGNFRGSTGVLRDISDRQERAEELRRQNERLDRFASMVSHDLRNPLNVAAGRIKMEQRDHESENLVKAGEALRRMGHIVEDVLSLARQGQRGVDTDPASLAACAGAAWKSIDGPDASLAVADDGATLLAEESQLCQLFENLFRNAVEHAGPEVAIRVGRLDGDGSAGSAGAGFYVEDDGPGIPAAERDRVFEYGRSDSEEGTGFGLAIVDGIAEAHGWDVVATEGESGGARIEVTGVEWAADG